MATIQDSYFGVAEETVYGTPVAPARFLEFSSESLNGKYERIESESFRAGQKVLRSDRFVPNAKGAEGDVKIEAIDTTIGLLLKHALGTVSTGTAVSTIYPHTFTPGDLKGKSLTVQVGETDASGALQIFTYEGGKIDSWELSNQADGVLDFNLTFDFEKETIGAGSGPYAASTPTYTAGSQLFVFNSAVVTVGGSALPVSDISIKGDNKLKTDRYYSNNGGQKKEPITEGLKEFTWSLKAEFDGLVQANRVAASIASGALAAIVVTWTSANGELTVTIPNARFDEGPIDFDGAQIIEHGLSGIATEDGTLQPITILYKTKDATP